ncbi:unnamed protein product [Mytilus edulis]|uniref:Uncharacterized protein n=1 Tax=Mytilus edulis TaxID=6550 RepID=A0A8S3TGI8_MYTED|nr:unnamed protein product [Mytilus edulis]
MYYKTPLSQLPVGGRLTHFLKKWISITSDCWVLSVIRGGLTLQFKEQPPLSPVPIPLSNTQDPQKFLLLSTEVETLLTRGQWRKSCIFNRSRFLFSSLPCIEEDRRNETGHRFVYPQLLYDYSPFQNGDQSFNKSFYSSRYVDNIPGPDGRLFSCPSLPFIPQIPSVCLEQKGLPVQGSPFWSVNCTTSFHQTYAGSNCSPSFTGYSDSFLPGRLTDQGTFSRETLSQYRCSHQIAALSGVSHFLEKVGPHSVSGLYFPRRTLPYSSVHSSTSSGKVSESLFKNSSVSISKNSHCSPVFTTARSLKFSSRCCSTWSPSHSTSSILSTPTLAPSYTELGVSSSNHSSGIVSSFGLVDFSSKRFERPTSVLSSPKSDSVHRCLQPQLGSLSGRSFQCQEWDSRSFEGTHQHTRNEGSASCPVSFSVPTAEQISGCITTTPLWWLICETRELIVTSCIF